MRKRLLLVLLALALPCFASSHSGSAPRRSTCCSAKSSDKTVRGYTKKNGTHVNSYQRSAADGTTSDNFSTKGYVNPYTGKKGTKAPKN